jgi:3-isopropylmalate dehydrogenase
MQLRITALPGDGIGPEVVAEGLRVLDAVARQFNHTLAVEQALIGGAAIDATGSALPDETLRLCHTADAVLLGAVGGPKWDSPTEPVRPEMGLLAVRKALGLFANLRPVTVHPALIASSPLRADRLAGVDILVIRELTGGLYFGPQGRDRLPDGSERAYDTCVYTTHEVERVVRVAATLARSRRGKLTSVDKANVLTTSRLWRNVTTRVMQDEFPDVELEHLLVDACAMHLIRRPADFDVIVTENMFGDILTDEASVIAGSMGMLPSASLGTDQHGLYEPIHGSAPDIAGKGIANPIGMILSVALMLRHSFELRAEARAIEQAVAAVLYGSCLTPDISRPGVTTATTRDIGAAVAAQVSHATVP